MIIFHKITFRLWIAFFGLLTLSVGTLAAQFREPATATSDPPLAEPITKGQRVFTCGHSFHVWVPDIVADLCKKAEIADHVQLGVSSIGGSRTIQHWEIPADKNTAKEALATGKVDVLTLSPIFLPDAGIENFTTLALEHNKDIRVIVQPIWLRWDIYEPTTKRPEKVDHNAITGEELRERHAEHFQKMDEHIRELNQKYGKTVLYIAPAPQAVIALREKIIAGEAPGLKTQEDLFTDELGHGNPPLMALVGYVNYATMYRRSPIGLPVPEILKQAKLGDQEEPLNRLLQELAWNAVVEHPLSGVRKPATGTVKADAETNENAAAAIQAAVAFLSKQQQADGSWQSEHGGYTDGVSALCVLALLNTGVEVQDERVQRGLQWLRLQEPKQTYSVALQTIAYCLAGAKEDVPRIERTVAWLAETQAKKGYATGGWSYGEMSLTADGSNTRFAIWALDAARQANVNIPETVWRRNADYWLESQKNDGTWSYTANYSNGTPTMTLAGIACLGSVKHAVADELLHEKIDQAVARAWKQHEGWCKDSKPTYLLTSRFRYYAYQALGQAAERTSHVRFGDADWKPLVTQRLLKEQRVASGTWNEQSVSPADSLVGTSLALLFLAGN